MKKDFNNNAPLQSAPRTKRADSFRSNATNKKGADKQDDILNNSPLNRANRQRLQTKDFTKKQGQKQQKNRVNANNSSKEFNSFNNHDYNSVNSKRRKNNTQSVNPLKYYQPLGKLKVMFLGGVGEIGKNITVFEYGNSMVVIDSGMSFPTNDMPGVDVVIPDMSYIIANQDKLKGILLTHGHEDHIGSLPFLVQKLKHKVDIYGTKLTLGLVGNKLLEHDIVDKVNMVAIADKSVVSLDDFTAEFIHVSHSVAGSVAICLRTPVGTVFHTGDFKVDYTPLGNEIMNLNRIAEIGKEGVLLLMSESTNAEKPGYTVSESVVSDTMNKLFSENKGRRIIIATFASNIDRLGMIMSLAKLYKRKIAVSGRSMIKYIDTAARVGYIKLDNSLFVDIDKVDDIEDGKLVILSTGSQGEPMSALTRMASGEFNKVRIGSNDTIIISATPIPGNEKDVYNVINNLYRLGAIVIYSRLADVHVSGHACQEELKLMYTLIRPKNFMPIHGEYRHLKQHAMLVEKLGHKSANIILPDLGDIVELNANTFKLAGKVACGNVMVDGLGVGDVGNIVLKDRLTLAEDGMLVVVVGVDKTTGEIKSEPEIISRGCFFSGDDSTIDNLKRLIKAEVAKDMGVNYNAGALKSEMQRTVRHYFRVKLKRNPMVLPIVLEW